MTVLFGHPAGNPNSHHAALAHFDAKRLEAFCVPWMPSLRTLNLLDQIGTPRAMSARLRRRYFPPLADAPKIQGRMGELRRLITRASGHGDEALSYEANEWLMATMTRECRRPAVSAVHAYEDCALSQFIEAKRLGKACLYDMPIGYYPAWEQTQSELAQKFADWLPPGGLPSARYARPQQKRQEMEMADLIFAPSSFVAETIRKFHPNKAIALARYGVDVEFWNAPARTDRSDVLRFIFAGQVSLRKGIPILLQAWKKADLPCAELKLVGSWCLSESKKKSLPCDVVHVPALSPDALREQYRGADVFVCPSFFEGFPLVLLEAMACGLPVIASTAAAPNDLLSDAAGRALPIGDEDALVDALRCFNQNRVHVTAMGHAARKIAQECTWESYRDAVTAATARYI